jgi:hypothetical protein
MQKWEYLRLQRSTYFYKEYIDLGYMINGQKIQDHELFSAKKKTDEIDEALKVLGSQGWELVNVIKVTSQSGSDLEMFFKRPLPS